MPEQIGKTNMWKLFPNEKVEGVGGSVQGLAIVRVEEFSGKTAEEKIYLVQAGNQKIQVTGPDFPSTVKTG